MPKCKPSWAHVAWREGGAVCLAPYMSLFNARQAFCSWYETSVGCIRHAERGAEGCERVFHWHQNVRTNPYPPKIKIQKESWVFHQEDILSFYSAHLLISFLPLVPNKGKIPPAALHGRPLATLGIWPNYLCTTGTQIFHFPHGGLASDRKSPGYKQPALCLQGGWEGQPTPTLTQHRWTWPLVIQALQTPSAFGHRQSIQHMLIRKGWLNLGFGFRLALVVLQGRPAAGLTSNQRPEWSPSSGAPTSGQSALLSGRWSPVQGAVGRGAGVADTHLGFCFPTCNYTKSKQKMMFPKAWFSAHICLSGWSREFACSFVPRVSVSSDLTEWDSPFCSPGAFWAEGSCGFCLGFGTPTCLPALPAGRCQIPSSCL